MKSADYFCSNPAHRQNERQTDRTDHVTNKLQQNVLSNLLVDVYVPNSCRVLLSTDENRPQPASRRRFACSDVNFVGNKRNVIPVSELHVRLFQGRQPGLSALTMHGMLKC